MLTSWMDINLVGDVTLLLASVRVESNAAFSHFVALVAFLGGYPRRQLPKLLGVYDPGAAVDPLVQGSAREVCQPTKSRTGVVDHLRSVEAPALWGATEVVADLVGMKIRA